LKEVNQQLDPKRLFGSNLWMADVKSAEIQILPAVVPNSQRPANLNKPVEKVPSPNVSEKQPKIIGLD
jgi:hypothetical protein